jgi:phosphatidylglycerol lysyltransferase
MTKNRYAVIFQTIIAAAIGISLVIQPAITFIRHNVSRYSESPINPYVFNARLVLVILGLVLIYVTFYIYKRRQVAHVASIILAALAMVIMLLMRHKDIFVLAIEAGFIIWMVTSRRLYTVRSDLVRLTFGIRVSAVFGIVGYLYVLLGLLLLGPNSFYHVFTFQEAATTAFQTLFTFTDLDTPTRQALLFNYSANVISVILFVIIIGSLFKPVRFTLISNKNDKQKAYEILKKSSISSEDNFKLWPNDKHYYFSSSQHSFLAYKTSGSTAIILGDPAGDPDEYPQLITHFQEFVESNGWSVAAINTTNVSQVTYKQSGFGELFIGNEAVINIADYIDHTSHSKHFRYTNNRATRDGLCVEYWETVDDKQVSILKQISDAWLSTGGHKEYTFFMGYFDPVYLKNCSVMVLKQNETVVGYINVVPSFVKNEASIDHFRALANISPASMHFLMSCLILHLSDQGKMFLNIGFAPLSGMELRDGKRPATEKLLLLLKRFGNRFYSFRGVEQFKGKFQPLWHPRYLYYSGNITSLGKTVQDIEQASRLSSSLSNKRKTIGGIIIFLIIAALIQLI